MATKPKFKVGDIVKSLRNPLAPQYTVVRVYEKTCWVRTNDNHTYVYRGIPYADLELVSVFPQEGEETDSTYKIIGNIFTNKASNTL